MPFGMLAMFAALSGNRNALCDGLFRSAQASSKVRVSALSSVSLPSALLWCTIYVNLNIGLKLTVQQSIAYSCAVTIVGIVTRGSSIDPLPIPSRRYSYRNASIGSRLAAFIAGIIPLTVPTITRITVATTTLFGEMIR